MRLTFCSSHETEQPETAGFYRPDFIEGDIDTT